MGIAEEIKRLREGQVEALYREAGLLERLAWVDSKLKEHDGRISRLEHACTSLLHKDANEEPEGFLAIERGNAPYEEVDDLVEHDDCMGRGVVDAAGDETLPDGTTP